MDAGAVPTFPSLQGLRLEARRRFRALNTEVEIVLADWTEAWRLAGVEALFHAFEARFSRFLPSSELGRLNSRTVPTAAVSAELMSLLVECRRFSRLTGGVFNPLVIEQLEAAGYDRSFELLGGATPATAAPVRPPPSFECVRLDQAALTVSAPLGVRLDLGGIGKGCVVDAATDTLVDAGGFLIDAGGDIYAAGRDQDGQPWLVEVADPHAPEWSLARLRLSDQAVATSWTVKRRWQIGDGWANHLIDARSGRPVDERVIGATVVATSAIEADVFAKTALILGPEGGIDFLRDRGVAGLLVLADGALVATADWPGETIDRPQETEEP